MCDITEKFISDLVIVRINYSSQYHLLDNGIEGSDRINKFILTLHV
jgi:hypothetical protein